MLIWLAGGWLKDHPLPADKSTFGTFEALSQENIQVIRQILESKSSLSSFTTSYDQELLRKLRDFYSSCLAENELNDIGALPLAQFVRTVRRLYRSEGKASLDGDVKPGGLTAAVAYLHSKGISHRLLLHSSLLTQRYRHSRIVLFQRGRRCG